MAPDNHPDKTPLPPEEQFRTVSPESTGLTTPQPPPCRDIVDHSPTELCFHNVSPITLEILLSEALPEISPFIQECLYQAVLYGTTIPHTAIQNSYTASTPYSITQKRHVHLGSGAPEETLHSIVIERHSDEEPRMFELCLGKTNPRAVDFKVSFMSMYESEKWESVDAWGSVLGIDSITRLFKDAPVELCEYDEEGYCVSLISGDISILTAPAMPRISPQSESAETEPSTTRWIPKSLQISAPLYGEQVAVLSHLSPPLAHLIIQSGLLATIDAFGCRQEDLQARLLSRSSAKLSEEITIEFFRHLNVGDHTAEASDQEEENYEGLDDSPDLAEDTDNEHYDEAEASEVGGTEEDPDEPRPFCAAPLENPPLTSGVAINFYSEDLGVARLEYFSAAQPHGSIMIHAADLFNFAEPVIGVWFSDPSPSMRQLAARWRLFRELGFVGGIAVTRKDLEVNLSFSATSPSGTLVSADIGSHRVLMAFTPPSRSSATLDTALDS